jgi:hypothetical protein
MSKVFGNINWEDVTKKIKEQESKKGGTREEDKRIYKAKLKDDGSAQVLMRFVPSPDSDIPFVKCYAHVWQGPGGWFFENCPTTLGKECPVCQENNKEWEAGNQEIARKRKRKLSYWANILIIKDPQTPENDGKVFILKYGVKIHDKIMEQISPKEDAIDDNGNAVKPVMVFDMDNGANFKLSVKTTQNGPNYDASKFADTSKLTKEQQKVVAESVYPILPFADPNTFKSYDELKARFEKVEGAKVSAESKSSKGNDDDDAPAQAQASAGAPAREEEKKSNSDGDDSDDSFIQKLKDQK